MITVLWDVMPCTLVRTSETSVETNQTTGPHIPKYSTLQSHHRENIKSHTNL
jgi:hypothetical protein